MTRLALSLTALFALAGSAGTQQPFDEPPCQGPTPTEADYRAARDYRFVSTQQPPTPAPTPPAPAPGLTVVGQYTLTVTMLPFQVVAPAGYKLYFWELPPGWVGGTAKVSPSPSLTITQASGTGTVSCTAVDDKWNIQALSISLAAGQPAPTPPPTPTDTLAKAIQDAYAAAPDVAGKVLLTAYYRAVAPLWRDPSLKPAGTLYKAIGDKRTQLGLADATLTKVRGVVGDAMAAVGVSGDAAQDVPADKREAMAQVYEKAAAALEGIK